MEEDLEELKKIWRKLPLDDSKGRNAISNLIARNKELEKENEKIRKANKTLFELTQHTAMQEFINEDYIAKSKARELIQKLDKEEKQELKGVKGQDRYFIKQMYQAKRSVIEDLLQEGDK